jgi:hypothetical protein
VIYRLKSSLNRSKERSHLSFSVGILQTKKRRSAIVGTAERRQNEQLEVTENETERELLRAVEHHTTFDGAQLEAIKYAHNPDENNLYADEVRPERDLLVAVLECAIKDAAEVFESNIRNPRKEMLQARDWFNAEEDKSEPMSFAWICHELDFDCAALRVAIFTLIENFKHSSRDSVFTHRSRVSNKPGAMKALRLHP